MASDHEWCLEDDHDFQEAEARLPHAAGCLCGCEEQSEFDEFMEGEELPEDDGQPTEMQEWADFMGGDEYYDHSEMSGYDD